MVSEHASTTAKSASSSESEASSSNEQDNSSESISESRSSNMRTKHAVKPVSSASSESEHVTNHVTRAHLTVRATDSNEQPKQRPESVSQRRGVTLSRGYRAPQWPWLPFTVADIDNTHTSRASNNAAAVALTSLQVGL